jgi:hypothetical protein
LALALCCTLADDSVRWTLPSTATGGANFFGGRTIQTATIPALEARETAAHADMFIVLSDVWLDRPDSLANLQRLLEGFNSVEIVPTMFVFMGNFLSQPINTTHGNYEQYKGERPSLACSPPPRASKARPIR